MMIAYKGFNPDLSYSLGCGNIKYSKMEWNEENEASAGHVGMHCAADPLDCLDYYPVWKNSVYFMVMVDGDINETNGNSQISCTRMKLLKQLTLEEFVFCSVNYIAEHPYLPMNHRVESEQPLNMDSEDFLIVRGKDPVAGGRKGMVIGLLKESLSDNSITDMSVFTVGKDGFKENVLYDVTGKKKGVI